MANIFYHKKTGHPVQIMAKAHTKPTYELVICYQELEYPYEHYVMEQSDFFAEYARGFEKLTDGIKKEIIKRDDLPDHTPMIEKGSLLSPMQERMMAFFDAKTYKEKIKIFDDMREADDHILANIAAALDITLSDDADDYERIMSEILVRARYESDRGERL